MSFLRKFIKINNNIPKDRSLDTNQDESIRRKVDRKLAMCQSDPEPILDLSACRLPTISAQIQTTIKIYGKTDCRFDENQFQEFAVESVQSMAGVRALHLSYNHIRTVGPHLSLLIHLKELYLSHNQLSALPDSTGKLPALKILALRDNQFTAFPECVTRCPALTCLDLGDNQLARLSPSILRLKLLKSLQLDGNPLELPALEACAESVDAILSYVQRNAGADSGHGFDDNVDNDCEELLARDRGVAADGTGSDDEKYDPIVEGIEYQNYHNLKDQKKRALIEWERKFQSTDANGADEGLEADKKKQQLLDKLWADERQVSADINSRQRQKDRDRQSLLDGMSQLDTHSRKLLDNLYNWEDRHRNQQEVLERDERLLLDRMLRYDKEVVLRKSAILIAMQEMLNRESTARALTDDLKEFNQLELRTKINQQERLQRQAFEALQRTRDYRTSQLTGQIGLIERELSQLTSAEMQRKDERLDTILADISGKRRELAALLAKLLAQKRERDAQLRQRVLDIERRRLQVPDDDEFWLVQYQCLMERQPLEAQLRQLGIDDRIAAVLTAVHQESERVANYLTLFTDLTYDRLNSMGDKAILALGVDDYDLCQLIRDKLDELHSRTAGAEATGAVGGGEAQPSAPVPMRPMEGALSAVQEAQVAADDVEVDLIQLTGQLADVRLWREAECVVCIERICDVVFLPCGHVCTCSSCSLLISACPLCRVAVDDKLCLNQNT